MSRVKQLLLTSLFVAGCVANDDVESRVQAVHDAAVVDDLTTLEPSPCTPETDHWGCPGLPCAHGHCWLGECVGVVVDEDGQTLDPGVCCTDENCDAD